MELQKKLEQIFNNDYPGTQLFINEVIKPVFGEDVERINKNILDTPKSKAKANKAGIKSISYVADIVDENLNSNMIALFDVVLNDSCNVERSRVNIQDIIRSELLTYSHVFILFHYENPIDKPWRLSYAYKEGTLTSMTSAKRYTYVFGRDYRGRTAADRFDKLSDSEKTDDDLIKAFSVQALSDDFFDKYRAYYAVFVKYITGEDYAKDAKDDNLKKNIKEFKWLIKDPGHNQFAETFNSQGKIARDYIKKMFGRIIFLYFLQRKGWLYDNEGKADHHYMHNLYLNAGDLQDNFLDEVLETLFFYVLNTDGIEKRKEDASIDGKDITVIPGWQKIPYLNGGLFLKDEIDEKTCKFPAIYFEKLFEFLDSFNFTIDENDEEDAEIGIDPEMLGRIFESLLEDNKDKGAYYTPKPIVDFMCRESIIAYLQEEIKFVVPEQIRNLVENLTVEGMSDEACKVIKETVKEVAICDPAIGSGAFPMGLLNLLFKLRVILNDDLSKEKIKRDILENNIYGVDIEQGAVDIARLRFWLSMIVDEPKAIPLPNLHFKIMQGNSLLERYKGEDLSKLTQYENNTPDGTIDFSDNGDRKRLSEVLKIYYNIREPKRKKELLQEIISNVKCQLEDKGICLKESFDPSANSEFFLWHTWFNDVFEKKGGFDIVIGNPPYNEVQANNEYQAYNTYSCLELYAYFFELGLSLLKTNGILTFITGSLYIKGMKFEPLRILLSSETSLISFRNEGDKVFKDVGMPTSTILIRKDTNRTSEWPFKSNNIIKNIESNNSKLGEICKVQRGLEIGKNTLLKDGPIKILVGKDVDKFLPKTFSNISHTTLNAFAKDSYYYEGERFLIRETGSELVVTYLKDPIYVNRSLYTFKIKSNFPSVKYLVGCLNSKLAQYYYVEKFKAPTDLFPKIRIGQAKMIPVPTPSLEANEKITKIVDLILLKIQKGLNYDSELYHLNINIYKLYGLDYDEVLIIDPAFSEIMSRDEYENFKVEE